MIIVTVKPETPIIAKVKAKTPIIAKVKAKTPIMAKLKMAQNGAKWSQMANNQIPSSTVVHLHILYRFMLQHYES